MLFMDPVQKQALIERLYENESLTDNLHDADAKALLKWAEEQIRNNTDGELVTAAVSTTNQSGTEGVQALLSQASAFLAQASQAQAVNAAPDAENTGATTSTQSQAASEASLNDAATEIRAAPASSAPLGVSGESGTAPLPLANAQAQIAPAVNPPAKKSRRSTKRKKK
jgi:hypothetical protein